MSLQHVLRVCVVNSQQSVQCYTAFTIFPNRFNIHHSYTAYLLNWVICGFVSSSHFPCMQQWFRCSIFALRIHTRQNKMFWMSWLFSFCCSYFWIIQMPFLWLLVASRQRLMALETSICLLLDDKRARGWTSFRYSPNKFTGPAPEPHAISMPPLSSWQTLTNNLDSGQQNQL